MALQFRTFTQKDMDRIAAFHRGEIEMPKWIIDWGKKLDAARNSLAAAVSQETLTPEQQERYIQAIVQMMRRKDRLYSIWMDELPFKSWEDLAAERPPSADDLFQFTVNDTEDYLNGPGVPAFAFFLNERWPGFFKDFAHQCLRDCDPLLEEALELTPHVRHLLSYPERAFETTNKEIIEEKLTEWTRENVPKGAPNYTQRLLIANVMVALGHEMGACTQMEFARCEAAAPNFEELMRRNDPQADVYLLQAQHWQIDVLLSMWPTS